MKNPLIRCLWLAALLGCLAAPAHSLGEATPLPVPGVTLPLVPAATPAPSPAPHTYEGDCFRFDYPGSWTILETPDGVFFYPEGGYLGHTFLAYREADNPKRLTEASVDLALLFSSEQAVTSLMAQSMADSGMTDFELAPVAVAKTQLNGHTCYRGAADLVYGGQACDFVGHMFLRGDRLILLIWVGEAETYDGELKTVYGSIESVL